MMQFFGQSCSLPHLSPRTPHLFSLFDVFDLAFHHFNGDIFSHPISILKFAKFVESHECRTQNWTNHAKSSTLSYSVSVHQLHTFSSGSTFAYSTCSTYTPVRTTRMKCQLVSGQRNTYVYICVHMLCTDYTVLFITLSMSICTCVHMYVHMYMYMCTMCVTIGLYVILMVLSIRM